jgi:hypothetical protein
VKGGSTIEDLKQVAMEKVFLVHINDVRSLPIGIKEQSRRFRFSQAKEKHPEGNVRIFIENGYNGFYCCEIFNKDYWSFDPLTFLEKSKKSMQIFLFRLPTRSRY